MPGVLQPFAGFVPRAGEPLEAAPTARLIGRTRLGAGCVLAHCATIRGDGQEIEIGDRCWFGEHSTVHIVHYTVPTRIGSDVTVARGALVHAVTVGDGAVVGEGAVLLDGAEIGAGAAIAPRSLVPPRKRLDGGSLYSGVPAVAVRPLAAGELEALRAAARRPGPQPARRGLAGRVSAPEDALVCDTVVVDGELSLGTEASVWFGTRVLASGGGRVSIGARSNVQDNSTLVAEDAAAVEIGERVTVGHNVTIEPGCRVLPGALVANGSHLGRGTVVEAGACVAAAAFVPPGSVVAAGMVWAGRPARPLRPVTPEERKAFGEIPGIYADEYRPYYLRR